MNEQTWKWCINRVDCKECSEKAIRGHILAFIQGPHIPKPSLPPSLCWHWASSCGSKIHQKRAFTHQLIHIPHLSSTMQLFTHVASLAGLPHSSKCVDYSMRVGLLVIKLVVMLLPNVLHRALWLKALPLKGWKSTGATLCLTRSFTIHAGISGQTIHGDKLVFPPRK